MLIGYSNGPGSSESGFCAGGLNASRIQVFRGSAQLQWEAIMQANHCLKKYGIQSRAVLSWLWTALFLVQRGQGDSNVQARAEIGYPGYSYCNVEYEGHGCQR